MTIEMRSQGAFSIAPRLRTLYRRFPCRRTGCTGNRDSYEPVEQTHPSSPLSPSLVQSNRQKRQNGWTNRSSYLSYARYTIVKGTSDIEHLAVHGPSGFHRVFRYMTVHRADPVEMSGHQHLGGTKKMSIYVRPRRGIHGATRYISQFPSAPSSARTNRLSRGRSCVSPTRRNWFGRARDRVRATRTEGSSNLEGWYYRGQSILKDTLLRFLSVLLSFPSRAFRRIIGAFSCSTYKRQTAVMRRDCIIDRSNHRLRVLSDFVEEKVTQERRSGFIIGAIRCASVSRISPYKYPRASRAERSRS